MIPAPSPTLRPIVGGTANSVAFGSFHAPSGNHAAAEGVLGSQLAQASVVHPHLVFGGDANWNILQQQVAGSIQALQPPGATHQSGGQLDGMVCATSVQSTPLINLGMTVVSVANTKISMPYTFSGNSVLRSGVKIPAKVQGTYSGINTHDINVHISKQAPSGGYQRVSDEALQAELRATVAYSDIG